MSDSKNHQNAPEAAVNEADLYLSFRLMKSGDLEGAKTRIEAGLEKARSQNDAASEGLYLSAEGLLHKLRQDYKESYKCYQQAEKLLPDDSSLKIITAALLIDEFKQYDTALRKLKKVLETAPFDPAAWHHARALTGIAHLASGKKAEAKSDMEAILARDFSELRSAANVNFKLTEFFVAKDFEPKLSLVFLEKALALAQARHEAVYVKIVTEMIARLKKLLPAD